MFNAGGGITTTCEAEMSAYDQLPGRARKALQDAIFDWAAQPIKNSWDIGRRGYRNGAAIAGMVARCDRERIASDNAKVWGIPR